MADSYYERIELGEPFDCETCGTSYDTIGVEQDGDGWYVRRELGCYSGFGQQYRTVDEAIQRLEEFMAEELIGKKNKRNKRAIKAMIAEMLEASRK